MEQKKSAHGGARAGAGRKRKEFRPITVGLTPENWQWLDEQGNKTKTVNALIDSARERGI